MTANPSLRAAVSSLIVLHLVMLAALLARVPPHPPDKTALFGIAPLISAVLSACVASLALGSATPAGRAMHLLAAALSLVSFGPQKYADPQFPLIWPAVLTAQVAIIAIAVNCIFRKRPGHVR